MDQDLCFISQSRADMLGETNLEMREHVGMVANEESVRHVGQFLWVLLSNFNRGSLLVSDDVVHEGCPTGSRVAQPHSLLNKIVNYQTHQLM